MSTIFKGKAYDDDDDDDDLDDDELEDDDDDDDDLDDDELEDDDLCDDDEDDLGRCQTHAISPTELLGQVHQRLGRVTVASLIPKEIGSVHNAFYADMDIGLPILRIVDVATLEMHMEQATFIDSLTGHTSPRPPDAESLFYYRVEALD